MRLFEWHISIPQEAKIKISKRGTFIKSMPKFSNDPDSELSSRMYFSSFVLTSMSLALQTMLNQVRAGVIKFKNKDLIKFILRCKEDS